MKPRTFNIKLETIKPDGLQSLLDSLWRKKGAIVFSTEDKQIYHIPTESEQPMNQFADQLNGQPIPLKISKNVSRNIFSDEKRWVEVPAIAFKQLIKYATSFDEYSEQTPIDDMFPMSDQVKSIYISRDCVEFEFAYKLPITNQKPND